MQCDDEQSSNVTANQSSPVLANSERQTTGPPYEQTFNGSSDTLLSAAPLQTEQFVVYPQRWLILLAVCVTTICITTVDEFDPIQDLYLMFLELYLDTYTTYNIVFLHLGLLTTFICAHLIDRLGIRFALYSVACLSIISNGVRATMFYQLNSTFMFKFSCWFLINCIGTLIMPLMMCLPFKISELWFAESERTVAWASMTSAYFIGVGGSALAISTVIQSLGDFRVLSYVNIFCLLIQTPLILFGVQRSQPPTPPAKRISQSTTSKQSLLKSLKIMLRNREIMLHSLVTTINCTISMAAHYVLQKMLIDSGHIRTLSGQVIFVQNILLSLVQIPASKVVDLYPKSRLTLICKLMNIAEVTIFICWLLTCINESSGQIEVLAISVAQTVIVSFAFPTYQSMTATLTVGRIPEATMSAAKIVSITIACSFFKYLFTKLRRIIGPNDKGDYTYSVIFVSSVGLISVIIYSIFFNGKNGSEAINDNNLNRDRNVEDQRNNISNRTGS